MAFRGSLSRSLISTARSSLRSPPAIHLHRVPTLPAPRSDRHRRLLSFASPGTHGELGCVQSLLLLHSVVAAASLTSHLSVSARACCELSQVAAIPMVKYSYESFESKQDAQ